MHELSIAMALWKGAQQHVPLGATLRSLRVRVGPLQMLEPSALEFAWEAVCREQGSSPVALTLELPPWHLVCTECGRAWESPERFVTCSCGSALLESPGAEELILLSLVVEEAGHEQPACGSMDNARDPSHRECAEAE